MTHHVPARAQILRYISDTSGLKIKLCTSNKKTSHILKTTRILEQ